MLKKVQIVPTYSSKPSRAPHERRSSSAAPLGARLLKTTGWQSATEAIEGCGHLQRLILEYGKQLPHSIMTKTCDKPESPCLHFCYCDSIRPPSGSYSGGNNQLQTDSGESDFGEDYNNGELVDEMTLAFPRKGDMIDYISELRLNTRRSTPLHWLEPEDKLAIHDITTKLKKAFQESHLHPCRVTSASAKLESEQPAKEDDSGKSEQENVIVRLPRRLRPASVRPAPRLAVAHCERCAQRQASAKSRQSPRFQPDANFMMKIVEACIGPSPLDNGETMFFLNAHSARAFDLAPPSSPTPMIEELSLSPRPNRETSPPPAAEKNGLSYTGFVNSFGAEKIRHLKEIAALKRMERVEKEKERLLKIQQQHAAMMQKEQQGGRKSPTSVAVKIPNTLALSSSKGEEVEGHSTTVEESLPSLPAPATFREMTPVPPTKSPRTVVIIEPPELYKHQQQPPTPPEPTSQPVHLQAAPKVSEKSAPKSHSPRWIEKSMMMKTKSHSPERSESVEPTTPKTIIPLPILKKAQPEPSPPPLPSPTKPSQPPPPYSAKPAEVAAKPPLPSSKAPPSESATSKSGGSSKRTPSKSAKTSRSSTSNGQTASETKTDEKPPPPTDHQNGMVPVEVFASKSPAIRDRTSSMNGQAPQTTDQGNVSVDGADEGDGPDPEEIAIMKAKMTNSAEPLNATAAKLAPALTTLSSGFQTAANSLPNSGRLSPPLVRPKSPETTAFKTLDDVESATNAAIAQAAQLEQQLAAGGRKLAPRQSSAERRNLRPPSVVKKGTPSPVPKPVPMPSPVMPVQSPDLTAASSRHPTTVVSPVEPENAVFVKSSERRAMKTRKADVIRATSQHQRKKNQHDGSASQRSLFGNQDDYDDDESDGGSGNDFQFQEEHEEVEVEEVVVEPSEPSEPSDDDDDGAGDLEVEIFEEREPWWRWTAEAARLFLEIEKLRTRMLMRIPSPIKQRRNTPSRGYKDPKLELEEQMTENARIQLQTKEQERFDFLTRLKSIRVDIMREKVDFRKSARETGKRIRAIEKEVQQTELREAEMAARFYAKQDRCRAQRKRQREAKETALKMELRALYDEPNEKERALEARRDEALLFLDYEMREYELTRIENLAIEYEEDKRNEMEAKEREIDAELDAEEAETRQLEAVEEELLLGAVRQQLEGLKSEIEAERGILEANRLSCDKKVEVLLERERELIQNRVEAERRQVEELTLLRDQMVRVFQEEEDAERMAREDAEQTEARRVATAVKTRSEFARLLKDCSLSPAFVYSYFRLLERPPKDDGPGGKKPGARRPNTAFSSPTVKISKSSSSAKSGLKRKKGKKKRS